VPRPIRSWKCSPVPFHDSKENSRSPSRPDLSIVRSQPGKLQSYIKDAVDGGAGDDGLLQRIQVTVWPDSLGEWVAPTAVRDDTARKQAYAIFNELDKRTASELAANCEGEGIPTLRFAPDAQELFNQWRDELEHRCRSKELEKTPAFSAHIGKYRSLMPSLALVFHLLDVAANREAPGPVTLQAAELAAAWCDFLEAHARKIYAQELSPGVSAAHTLAQKIESGEVNHGDSIREIYRHHWGELTSVGEVTRALAILETAGWVRVEDILTGGRSSDQVLIHPDLRVT